MTVTDIRARRERSAVDAAKRAVIFGLERDYARMAETVDLLWTVSDLVDALATVDVEDAERATIDVCHEAAGLLEDLRAVVIGDADGA